MADVADSGALHSRGRVAKSGRTELLARIVEPARRNIETIAALDAKSQSERGVLERISARITAFASRPGFIVLNTVWFAGWIAVNRSTALAFDPYPFTFLTLLTSLEAIFLTSCVLIAQHHLERQSDRRAALDLQVNLLAEAEMTKLLVVVTAIADHLGVPGVSDDADAQELATETDVAALMDAVEVSARLGISRETPPCDQGR